MRLDRRTGALLVAALVATIATLCAPPVAIAAPSAAAVTSDQAAVERAVERYAVARRAAASLDASLTVASDALDELVGEQNRIRRRLASRAVSAYRSGPLSFLEVMIGAESFEEFATRAFLIARINELAAADLDALEALESQARARTERLMRLQTEALARRAEAAQRLSRARAQFAKSRSAYAEFRRRVRDVDEPKPARRPSPRYAGVGSGSWRSAKASHYGRGSWGRRTADGTRIRSDTMIVAHKTLPFGTLVEFEFKGRRAVARVADRGPYTKGRVWDLGPGVIALLDFNGVHEVRYRIIER